MTHRVLTDHIDWKLYRHAWLPAAIALLVLLATSFRPDIPAPTSTLPASFTDDQAGHVIQQARNLSTAFPDRRPGSDDSLAAAEWTRGQLVRIGLDSRIVTTTTIDPRTRRSVPVINVEATLPGRTRDTVVVVAPRDSISRHSTISEAIDTVLLVDVAQQLSMMPDRRRTVRFISVDASTLGSAGSQLAASRLARDRRHVTAVIDLQRLLDDHPITVLVEPSGRYVPPIGLVQVLRRAVEEEGGRVDLPSVASQVVALGMPVSVANVAPFVRSGLPAVHLGPSQFTTASSERTPTTESAGRAIRIVYRSLVALEALDAYQSAGKTYVATDHRVYRGWAVKILIASLLLPFWAGVSSLVLRRRRLPLVAATGSVARALLAGLWGVSILWILGATGALIRVADLPPLPSTVLVVPVAGIAVWLALVTVGWIVARAPDWRHTREDHDAATIVVSLVTLGILAAVALAADPFTVLFAIPALHLWLLLGSRIPTSRRQHLLILMAGVATLATPAYVVAGRFGTGWHTPSYLLTLVQTRTIAPLVCLTGAMAAGVVLLLVVAIYGRCSRPGLISIRHRVDRVAELLTRMPAPPVLNMPPTNRTSRRSRRISIPRRGGRPTRSPRSRV